MLILQGTGRITAQLVQDTFTLGPLKVLKQTFGRITSEKGDVFVDGKFDGIFGLSFPGLSASVYTPAFDNILEQKLLTHKMFSFYYSLLPHQVRSITSRSRKLVSGNHSFAYSAIAIKHSLTLLFLRSSSLTGVIYHLRRAAARPIRRRAGK
jgi:hypothetical protein